ncbi:MAG: DUF504 domain-containing protein [Candidatus Nanoarchaeia archaeon]
MVPIKELLNKIKWDKKENKKDYEIGYWDRIMGKEIRINYGEIESFDDEFFKLTHTQIPLHRIRRVYKKGKLVWERR